MNNHFNGKLKIVCETGEVVTGYTQYLSTQHWKNKRVETAEKFNHTCARCSGIFESGYHIHHNSYKRIGKEKGNDLAFYCHRCHTIIHLKKQARKDFNKGYSNLISQKMQNFDEEQIMRVLDFIDKVSES